MIPPTAPLRVALITGASSGIGAASAVRLARSGLFRLVLSGRNAERLRRVERACAEFGARNTLIVTADLGNRDQLQAVIRSMDDAARIDALVNNAGVGAFGPTDVFENTLWDQLIAINLSAVFSLSRAAAARMKVAGGGVIVNISSDADSIGFEEAAAYCATKGGVLAMSRALRAELRQYGIRVCTVSPGRVDTCFNGKKPGMRPGALTADEVAEVVEFAITCSPNIELHEVRLDSMSRAS